MIWGHKSPSHQQTWYWSPGSPNTWGSWDLWETDHCFSWATLCHISFQNLVGNGLNCYYPMTDNDKQRFCQYTCSHSIESLSYMITIVYKLDSHTMSTLNECMELSMGHRNVTHNLFVIQHICIYNKNPPRCSPLIARPIFFQILATFEHVFIWITFVRSHSSLVQN